MILDELYCEGNFRKDDSCRNISVPTNPIGGTDHQHRDLGDLAIIANFIEGGQDGFGGHVARVSDGRPELSAVLHYWRTWLGVTSVGTCVSFMVTKFTDAVWGKVFDHLLDSMSTVLNYFF